MGFFCLGSFALKRCVWALFLGFFFHTKSMYKLIWSSKNVMNITKALNMRETYLDLIGKFFTVGKITYNICEDWLNPYIIASVFLFDWKLKFCWSSSIFGPFEAKIWVQVWSEMAKRGWSHTSHLTPNRIVFSNTLSKLKDELTA